MGRIAAWRDIPHQTVRHARQADRVTLLRRPIDSRIEQFKTLKAQAEVQPLVALAEQLVDLKKSGAGALDAYVRNVRLKLFSEAKSVIVEASHE